MTLIGFLVLVVVLAVVFWAIRAVLAATGTPDPVRTIVMVVAVLIALFVVLNALGIGGVGNLRLTN